MPSKLFSDKEILQIEELRRQGLGYRRIAEQLNLSVSKMRYYCRSRPAPTDMDMVFGLCLYCGKPLEHTPLHKKKKFCTEGCRRAWWKEHPAEINRKKDLLRTCEFCGKEFATARDDAHFCSRYCYALFRRREYLKSHAKDHIQGQKGFGEQGQSKTGISQGNGHDQATVLSRAELPHLPPDCRCAVCPWFYNGARHCQDGNASAANLPPADSKPIESEGKEKK